MGVYNAPSRMAYSAQITMESDDDPTVGGNDELEDKLLDTACGQEVS